MNGLTKNPGQTEKKDYLWLQIKEMPYFRGLLRAVEARAYQDIILQEPILDLGCGDGHFASITFEHPVDIGIDPWSGPVKLAAKQGSYKQVINGLGNQLPFPDEYFGSVVSNSVLEHVEDLDVVIKEVARVMKPNGIFIFCVPNHFFLENLSISSWFDRIHLSGFGNLYRKFFNRISRHYHCDSPEVWEKRLSEADFSIDKWWHYFSPKALHVLEWGHYFGLPSLMSHFLFRRWILIPKKWNLFFTEALTRSIYDEEPNQEKGSYSFYITHKNSHLSVSE